MDILEPTMQPESAQAATPPPPAAKPRSLWLNRDYMLLWSGQLVSTLGTGISGLAFPLLVIFLTGSFAQAGIAAALNSLPYMIFSLPFGALIDRWNRKLVMILCDAGRAILLGSIPVALYFNVLTIWQIYVVALLQGILFVLFDIAEVAALSRVVPKEQLPAATGQNQATFGLAFLFAPPLGGLLYTIQRMLPFTADAVSYVVSVISLGFIKTKFQGERASGQQRNLWKEIGEGIRWLWSRPLIRYMAFLTGILNLTSAGFPLIIIRIATLQGGSAFIIGLIITIGSVGAILGSIIGGFIQKRFTFAQVIIATVWIQTLAWPFLAFAPNAVALGLVSAVIFVVAPIYNIVQFSYRIALIPDALQGRVNSVFRLLAFGFQPLGAALTGVLLDQAGPVVHATIGNQFGLGNLSVQELGAISAVLILSIVQIVVALATQTNRQVRNAKPLADVQATPGNA